MAKWVTVTVTDAEGRRRSMDVLAESTYDAAHLYAVSAKSQQAGMLPDPCPHLTLATLFEVVVDGKVYRVAGTALQRWIVNRRNELNGPKGALFKQRPMLD